MGASEKDALFVLDPSNTGIVEPRTAINRRKLVLRVAAAVLLKNVLLAMSLCKVEWPPALGDGDGFPLCKLHVGEEASMEREQSRRTPRRGGWGRSGAPSIRHDSDAETISDGW